MSKKWTYELNTISDTWGGGIYDSREEAIREATNEALIEGIKKFKIGICENVFNYGIDADEVLERIAEETYEDVGEVAEDYLDDVTKEHKEELQDKLNEVFYSWQEKYNYKPYFYTVVSEEIIELEMKLCKIALEEHSNCNKCCKYCNKACNERCVFDKVFDKNTQSCDNEVSLQFEYIAK